MEKRYIKSFQGMRWIAALFIFFFHCMYILKIDLPGLVGVGSIGVSFFLILSGFLSQMKAGGGLLDQQSSLLVQSKNSLIKHVKRYLPLHWLSLIIAVVLDFNIFIQEPIYALVRLTLNATLLQAWVPIQGIYYSFNSGAWFLCVIVFWALISPFVSRLIQKSHKGTALLGCIAIFIVEILLAIIVDFTEIGFWLVYIFPLTRALDIISGCFLYKFFTSLEKKPTGIVNCALLIGSWLIVIALHITHMFFDSSLFSTAAWNVPLLIMIMSLAGGDENSKAIKVVFGNKIAVFLGEISFEFYLFHQLVLRVGNAGYNYFGFTKDGWLVFIALAVTILISSCYHLTSKSIIRRLQRRKEKTVIKQ